MVQWNPSEPFANGSTLQVTVTKDEGMREGLSLEALGKLKPAFKKGGTTTAGNSSQVRKVSSSYMDPNHAACLKSTRTSPNALEEDVGFRAHVSRMLPTAFSSVALLRVHV